MTGTRRWIALVALGSATAAAALALHEQEQRDLTPPGSLTRANSASSAPRLAAAEAARIPSAPSRERQSGLVIGNPFGASEPPRAAKAMQAAPTPTPPFPYRYAGQVVAADGNARLFLAKNNELIAVRLGEVLEGEFKVISISADTLEVKHLPSGKAVHILYSSLGGTQEPEPAASDPARAEPEPAFRKRAFLAR